MTALLMTAALWAGAHHPGCRTDVCERRVDHREHAKTMRRWRRRARPFRAWLASVRWCESRDDYGAVDPTGTYTGAYQFDDPTWRSVGGTTSRAMHAARVEQDFRAVVLRLRRGTAPWPVCG